MKKILLFAAVAAMIAVAAQAHKSKYVGTGHGSEDVTWTAQQDNYEMLPQSQYTESDTGLVNNKKQDFLIRYNKVPEMSWSTMLRVRRMQMDCFVTPEDFNGSIVDSLGKPQSRFSSIPRNAEIKRINLYTQYRQSFSTRLNFDVIAVMQEVQADSFSVADLKKSINEVDREIIASKNYTLSTGEAEDDYFDALTDAQMYYVKDKPDTYEMYCYFPYSFLFTGKKNVRLILEWSDVVDHKETTRLLMEGGKGVYSYANKPAKVANATILRTENDDHSDPHTIVPGQTSFDFDDPLINAQVKTIPYYTLPDIDVEFFTNDIKGKVTLLDEGKTVTTDDDPVIALQPNGRPLVRLLDCTTDSYVMPDGATALNSEHSAEVNADGSFSFTALNPEHTYQLSASSSSYGYYEIDQLNFVEGENGVKSDADFDQAYEGKKNDIVANVTLTKGTVTGVADVAASKQVAGIDYYNMQGQRSTSALEGVNVVVTRYTDGTTRVAKVVK